MRLSSSLWDSLSSERLARREIPQSDQALVSAGEDNLALLAGLALAFSFFHLNFKQSNRLDRLEHRDCPPQYTALEIPQVDNFVTSSTNEKLAVGSDVESTNNTDVAIQHVFALPRPQVPHSDLAIVGSTNESCAGAALHNVENKGTDDTSMSLEHMCAVCTGGVPHFDDTVR